MPDRANVDPLFATTHGVVVALGAIVDIAVGELDLTPLQYRTLAFCASQPATPTDVANWRAVKKQGVSRPLNTLVERGLLQREHDPADRRRMIHTITPAGLKLLAEADALIASYLDSVIARMPKTKAAGVRRSFADLGVTLDKIVHNT